MSEFINKDAKNIYDIHPIIKKRYSPRAFSDTEVDESILKQVFEAGRWAPSSRNVQPWRFLVGIKNKNSVYDKIFESLVEFNQDWNQNTNVLIAIIAKKTDDKGRDHSTYAYDTGQAAAYLTFQLMDLGLYAHQMGGFEKDVLREKFSISEEFEPIAIMSVGYRGSLDVLPQDFQEMEVEERNRRAFNDIVFWEEWTNK